MSLLRVPENGRVVSCDVTGANAGLPTPWEYYRANTGVLTTEIVSVGVFSLSVDGVWVLSHPHCNY